MRSCSCCFCFCSSAAWRSMLRLSCHREITTNATLSEARRRTAEEYSRGFLRMDCGRETGRDTISMLQRSEAPRTKVTRMAGRAQKNCWLFGSTRRKKNPVQSDSLCGVGQLAPSDKLDVLVCEQPSELRACKEVEIALSPGRPPGIALACGSAHLFVIESQMYNEDRHPGLETLQSLFIELRPFFRPHSRLYRNRVIHHQIIGAQ